MALDERPPTLPRGAPMDVLPLHDVLGGTRSGEFPAVNPEPDDGQPPAAAYEIELGDEDFSLEQAVKEAAGGVPVDEDAPISVEAGAAPSDDLDFSGLLDEEPPGVRSPPASRPPAPRARRCRASRCSRR